MTDFKKLQQEYTHRPFNKEDLKPQPCDQFTQWLEESISAGVYSPNAMALATCDKQGHPSVRIVLLKEYQQDQFIFFTNFGSRKSHELEENPHASLLFWWPPLHRQIRIEGSISKAAEEVSDKYFATRSKESNLGAYASQQSQVIERREHMTERYERYAEQFKDLEQVPRPNFWGGYVLHAEYYEFWAGRESRMHDRFCYKKQENNWIINRLAP